MGGLRKSIPLVYFCVLVGGAALAAMPLVTSSFYSKNAILLGALANGNVNLMIAGLIGAFITSLYTFRMIFIVFHGKEKNYMYLNKDIIHYLPLIVLLVLSTFIGTLITPPLAGILPDSNSNYDETDKIILEIVSGIVDIVGLLTASWLWLGKRTFISSITKSVLGRFFRTWWFTAWGFNWLYEQIFVKPWLGIVWLLRSDPLNELMNIPVLISRLANKGLLLSENGYLRWYVASMGIGAIVVLALMLII